VALETLWRKSKISFFFEAEKLNTFFGSRNPFPPRIECSNLEIAVKEADTYKERKY
jgi:hypothetical protein